MFELAPRIRRRMADVLLALVLFALAVPAMACSGADNAVLVIVSFDDVNVPEEVDTICLGLWDDDPTGGQFGQRYPVQSASSETLAVEAGSARSGRLLLHGYSQGARVALRQQNFSFTTPEVEASLQYCGPGRDSAPVERDRTAIPEGSTVAVSQGPEGAWIVVASPGQSGVYTVGGDGIEALSVSVPSAAQPTHMVAVDVDGDCDDDLIVFGAGGASLWERERNALTLGPALPSLGNSSETGVVLDANGDVFLDVAVIGADGLVIWLGGAAGLEAGFSNATLSSGAAIDAGDLDGDGNVDLAVGRSGQPDRLLFGDGGGSFTADAAALPEDNADTRDVALVDVDGDGRRDVLVTAAGLPTRVFAEVSSRRYEERTAALLPDQDNVESRGIAVGDWNGDCEADILVSGDVSRSWASGTVLTSEPAPPGTRDVLLDDLLGAGERDALFLTDTRLLWWRR